MDEIFKRNGTLNSVNNQKSVAPLNNLFYFVGKVLISCTDNNNKRMNII